MTLDRQEKGRRALRIGGSFTELADFCWRTRLPVDVVTSLICAGACDAWGERRMLLWQLGDLDYRPDAFDNLVAAPSAADLPAFVALEQTAWNMN